MKVEYCGGAVVNPDWFLSDSGLLSSRTSSIGRGLQKPAHQRKGNQDRVDGAEWTRGTRLEVVGLGFWQWARSFWGLGLGMGTRTMEYGYWFFLVWNMGSCF